MLTDTISLATISYNGLNLFFDGEVTTPGISVLGSFNGTSFVPNSSKNTFTLGAGTVAGSGTSFYSSGGLTAVLTGYDWNAPDTPPGDVCQPKSFTPGGGPDLYGSFTIEVFPSAVLNLGQGNGSPGTNVPLAGSGFDAGETVLIYTGQLGLTPIGTATADTTGGFATTVREPAYQYGVSDFFALGRTSGNMGASSFFVEPGMASVPAAAAPGGAIALQGLGFGAGETVTVYWNDPRTLLGTAVASSNGSFTGGSAMKVAVPIDAPSGLNIVLGVGQTTGAFGIGGVEVR